MDVGVGVGTESAGGCRKDTLIPLLMERRSNAER